MENYYVENKELLYKPSIGGMAWGLKRDFALVDTGDKLIMKGPPKSEATSVLIIGIITFIGMVVAFFMMMSIFPTRIRIIIVLSTPIYWGLVLFIYFFVDNSVKGGDWFEWDKKTGTINFPRLNVSDNIENFLMVQRLKCNVYGQIHVEIALIFTCGAGYKRYPMFLYNGLRRIDPFLIDLSDRLGGHYQKVKLKKNKPIISGYELQE